MEDRLPHHPRAPPRRASAHLRHDRSPRRTIRCRTPASACPETPRPRRRDGLNWPTRTNQLHPTPSTPPNQVPTTDQAPATSFARRNGGSRLKPPLRSHTTKSAGPAPDDPPITQHPRQAAPLVKRQPRDQGVVNPARPLAIPIAANGSPGVNDPRDRDVANSIASSATSRLTKALANAGTAGWLLIGQRRCRRRQPGGHRPVSVAPMSSEARCCGFLVSRFGWVGWPGTAKSGGAVGHGGAGEGVRGAESGSFGVEVGGFGGDRVVSWQVRSARRWLAESGSGRRMGAVVEAAGG